MPFQLVFDPALPPAIQEEIVETMAPLIGGPIPFQKAMELDYGQETRFLTILSDQQLKQLIEKLQSTNALFAFLPHPEGLQTCLGFNIPLASALEAILQNQDLPQSTDLLFCNEIPVFNYLATGYTFQLANAPGSRKIRSLFTLLKGMITLKPFRLDVLYKHRKTTKTSVQGVVVAQHKKSTIFSRMFLQDAYANDGMMHVYLLAPRSVLSLIAFFVETLFTKNTLLSFRSHIKTDRLVLNIPQGGAPTLPALR